MIVEPIKTVQEYSLDFKDDYEMIVNYGDNSPLYINENQNFEIFTLYTDTTPVTSSNSSTIIKR